MTFKKPRVATKPPKNGAFAVEMSSANKVGGCSVTYVNRVTCEGCVFLDNGCMTEHGNLRLHAGRIHNPNQSVLSAIDNEVAHIHHLSGLRPLRLHEAGDCPTDEAAHRIYKASARYTHFWHKVKRESWGNVSILASTESIIDAVKAMELGFAAALVVPHQLESTPKATKLPTGERLLPCPAESGLANCIGCGLCMNAETLLKQRIVIVFSAHGAGQRQIQARLRQLRED